MPLKKLRSFCSAMICRSRLISLSCYRLSYIDAVRAADPEAHIQLSIENWEGARRFQRLFICPSESHEAFQHCRSFLAMDGTFTEDIFNLTILMAASIDAANHAVLIAWAIVESENEDAWRFFAPFSSSRFYTSSHHLGFFCPIFTLQFQKSITHL